VVLDPFASLLVIAFTLKKVNLIPRHRFKLRVVSGQRYARSGALDGGRVNAEQNGATRETTSG
jgi:hypothetical protein